MKNNKTMLLSSITVGTLLFTTVSFADVCKADIHIDNQYIGTTICGVGDVSNISVLGNLYTNQTVISQELHVVGVATLSGGNVTNASINGDGNFTNVTMEGGTTLTGLLKASGVRFNGILTIYSPDVRLSQTSTQDIMDTDTTNPTESIYLQGTHVNGDITFASGRGVVYMDSGSSISGQVKGGKVVHD